MEVTTSICPGMTYKDTNHHHMTVKEQIVRTVLPVGAILASIGIGFAGITSAQTATTSTTPARGAPMERGMMGEKPAVMGKITAINGTTLTVEGMNKGMETQKTYTVNASGAKVVTSVAGSAPTESSVSTLAVGDMVAVRGTVSGTSVAATEIMEGMPMRGGHGGPGGRGGHGTHGTVSAVSGNTITITG